MAVQEGGWPAGSTAVLFMGKTQVPGDSTSNDARNGLIIAAPIIGTDRGIPVHLRVEAGTGGLTKTSFILCDQTGAFSQDRFLRYRGEVIAEILLAAQQITGRFIDAHLIYRQRASN